MESNGTAASAAVKDTSTRQAPIVAVWVVTTVLAGSAVGMRFYTRRVILHVLGAEDWLILISMVRSRPNPARPGPANLGVAVQVFAIGTCVGFIRREQLLPRYLAHT